MGKDSGLRRRNVKERKNSNDSQSSGEPVDGRNVACNVEESYPLLPYIKYVICALGLLPLCLLMYRVPIFFEAVHDANLWFINIQEVEREISFRTESGLYYSYYKQFVMASSVRQGLYELTHDNITEHPSTINILERFNIYQEVVLGVIYRYFNIQTEPIYFYIRTVFNLQGVLVGAVYVLTWMLSGSWLSGSLAVLFYLVNRMDVTRADYSIPLRENWSLPFLWLQQICLTYYFRSTVSVKHYGCIAAIFLCTFLFNITWQFTQFTLLLQSMATFGAWALMFISTKKVVVTYLCIFTSLLCVCALQFFHKMILGSLVVAFVPAAFIVMAVSDKLQLKQQKPGVVKSLAVVFTESVSVLTLMIVISTLIKAVIQLDADEHIFKFVLNKLGLGTYSLDFDVRLYMCNGAFEALPWDTFARLTSNYMFPCYAISHVILLLAVVWGFVQRTRVNPSANCPLFSDCPEWTFHIIQCVFFGVLAMSTQRMRYFWIPYMCILASAAISHRAFWDVLWDKLAGGRDLVRKLGSVAARHLVAGLLIAVIIGPLVSNAEAELSNLREFYDPDTVELMEWIKQNTPEGAAFTGSMQLLAGVKLCTGRHLTNHPHYEDTHLRRKTKELYKMYGKFSPEEVHSVMVKYKSNYIILEDSICMIPEQGRYCRLPDIVDIAYGQVPDNYPPSEKMPDLKPSKFPHFCDAVRRGIGQYGSLFKRVFENRTFRVYKVAPRHSK